MACYTVSQYTSDVTYYYYRILFPVQSEVKRLINEEGSTVDAIDHNIIIIIIIMY